MTERMQGLALGLVIGLVAIFIVIGQTRQKVVKKVSPHPVEERQVKVPDSELIRLKGLAKSIDMLNVGEFGWAASSCDLVIDGDKGWISKGLLLHQGVFIINVTTSLAEPVYKMKVMRTEKGIVCDLSDVEYRNVLVPGLPGRIIGVEVAFAKYMADNDYIRVEIIGDNNDKEKNRPKL